MGFKDLERKLFEETEIQNHRSIPEFEGYSPYEMETILYSTFSPDSPIKLQKLKLEDYKNIPLLNIIRYILGLIEKEGELKLTPKGNFQTKVVKDIYRQGYIKDYLIENGITTLNREADCNAINFSRHLLELSGIIKKRHNKHSLTKKGMQVIKDNHQLLMAIFNTIAFKFNWGYYDGYGLSDIGQVGFGFSLILLKKYGSQKRKDNFYADLYFKAFPTFKNNIYTMADIDTERLMQRLNRCYCVRTFERYLDYLGLIKLENPLYSCFENYVKKRELFDKLIKCEPPAN